MTRIHYEKRNEMPRPDRERERSEDRQQSQTNPVQEIVEDIASVPFEVGFDLLGLGENKSKS